MNEKMAEIRRSGEGSREEDEMSDLTEYNSTVI